MQITIDTTTELSPLDRRVLAALTAQGEARRTPDPITELPSREKLDELAKPKTAAKEVTIEEPEPQPAEKPRRTRKPKADPKPAPEPVQEPEEAPADARPAKDDAPATPAPEAAEADGNEPTVSDALELASELVAAGRTPEVKEILANIGAKRVRDLTIEQVPSFIEQAEKLKG